MSIHTAVHETMTLPHSLRWNLSLAIIAIMGCCLGLISFLNYCSFEKNFNGFVRSRFMVVARDLKHSVEYGLGLGLRLAELKNIQSLIEETMAQDHDISAIRVVDSRGSAVFQSGCGYGTGVMPAMSHNTLPARKTCREDLGREGYQEIILPVINQFNARSGSLVISYPMALIAAPMHEMRIFLTERFAVVFAGFSLVTLILVSLLTRKFVLSAGSLASELEVLAGKGMAGIARHGKITLNILEQDKERCRLQRRILCLTLALLLAAAVSVSFLAVTRFEQVLVPEMEKKGLRIGQSMDNLLVKILGYGVPFEKLRGTTEYFHEILSEHSECRYVALTMPDGAILYSSANLPGKLLSPFFQQTGMGTGQAGRIIGPYHDLSFPLDVHGRNPGVLHLGLDNNFIQSRIREIGYDVLTVLLISFILTCELLLLIFSVMVTDPFRSISRRLDSLATGRLACTVKEAGSCEIMRINHMLNRIAMENARDRKILLHQEIIPADVRGLLFLFIFSAMFPLAFLPISVAGLSLPALPMSREVVLSLPFAAYYMCSAIAIAAAGPWSERTGHRLPMVTGALLGAAGYAGCSLASGLVLFTACYSLAGAGFGLVMVACQGYIVDTAPRERRSSAMARFWAGFFSGTLCGTGMGALLAQHIGPELTLAAAVLPALASALLMASIIRPEKDMLRKREKSAGIRHVWPSLFNRRFLAVVFGLSVPAKLCMTGFMFYLVPRFLAGTPVDQAAIGRILMIYSLMFVIAGPFVSQVLEQRFSPAMIAIPSAMMAGVSLLLVYWQPGVLSIVFSIFLYGLFRSSSSPAATTMLMEINSREIREFGPATLLGSAIFLERAGSIGGPLLAGILMTVMDMPSAMACFGLFTLTGGFMALLALQGRNPAPDKAGI